MLISRKMGILRRALTPSHEVLVSLAALSKYKITDSHLVPQFLQSISTNIILLDLLEYVGEKIQSVFFLWGDYDSSFVYLSTVGTQLLISGVQ